MSAMVCGSKRTLFEDQMDPPASVSPPVSKRVRRCSPSSSSASPIRLSASTSAASDRLLALFPHVEPQILERAFQECGNDLDVTITRLNEMTVGSAGENGGSVGTSATNLEQGNFVLGKDECDVSGTPSASSYLHENGGAEWVKAFVNQMMSSTTLEDARARATNALEVLERSISTRVGAEAIKSFHKETVMLKEQLEVSVRENAILKRAVAIQHERQKEYDEKNLELQHLKQLVSQYQEQLRVLEVNNYALRMHLRQAEQSNAWPGRFHPDVF
ncbi:uncharacterized protein LOC116199372 [Punica granatum]|uniref:Uncharacterized protein n=2 Tax=Punica granatum TaxID=22663 RepID=A0A2I0HJV7_PUNGR|nr:uncharacterized protein LOC116199372 [Punica granatum]PKI32002.1 hypothetical protein CRG98_047611 [Punica granatum]